MSVSVILSDTSLLRPIWAFCFCSPAAMKIIIVNNQGKRFFGTVTFKPPVENADEIVA